MAFALRPYQQEALTNIDTAEDDGVRRQLGVAATGLGKTVMFVTLAKQRDCRTLILAHRDELVNQAADKVQSIWPDAELGIVKAGDNAVEAKVVIASVQTLSRPNRLQQLLDGYGNISLFNDAPGPFELVIVDEAHHSAAPTYRAILESLKAGETNGPLLLGVTATPKRGDYQGLHTLFDEITFNYDIEWGIRMGYLSDLRAYAVRLAEFDLTDVRMSRGDYAQGQAGRLLEEAGAPQYIVNACRQWAIDRKTLVFTPTVKMAGLVYQEFEKRGVAAGMVHGGTPLEVRRQLLADFSSGKLQVMVNCAVLTEGYDEPSVDCIVVARPTKSQGLYVQMVGRGTRRYPGKKDCLILDIVGATSDHRLVTAPTLFGLDDVNEAHNGGGTFTELLDKKEQELIQLGKLEAERVKLFEQFHNQMETTAIIWGTAHHKHETLRRYIRPLGKNRPVIVLYQRVENDDVWQAMAMGPDNARKLTEFVPLETAQAVAEDHVRRYVQHEAYVRKDAKWRLRPPSAKQIAAAQKWDMWNLEQYETSGELSDAMDLHIALKLERGRRGRNRF